MHPVIISSTKQVFNGEPFYLCGNYFQHKGKRLHRAVWEYHHGAVPDGYHVHHIDENRANNAPDNLLLVKGSEHVRHHMEEPERAEHSRQIMREITQPAACKWHRSAEGNRWHSEQGKANWQKRTMQTYICDFCGAEYHTKFVYGRESRRFCSANCKMKARRRRLNEGLVSQASRSC